MSVLISGPSATRNISASVADTIDATCRTNLGPWKWPPETAIDGGLVGLGPVEVIEAEVNANGCCVMPAGEVSVADHGIPAGGVSH